MKPFKNFFINDPPSPHSHQPLFVPMTEYIFDLITSLPNQTSCGHDEIPSYVIKATAPSIVSPIYNTSLIFPFLWAVSQDLFYHTYSKTSLSSSPSEYRPISLLCLFSKLLERHIP